MSSLARPVLALISAGYAASIWMAGAQLSNTSKVLDDYLHLGSALAGVALLLVPIATSLPEVAVPVAASILGHIGVAIGTVLGPASPTRGRAMPLVRRTTARTGLQITSSTAGSYIVRRYSVGSWTDCREASRWWWST